MLAMLEMMPPEDMFLADLFFPMFEQSLTEYVDIDIQKGTRKMAPFVAPVCEGHVVQKEGYMTNQIKVPYIKVKMPIKPGEILNVRQAGDIIYQGNSSPQARLAQRVAKDLAFLRGLIKKRIEWMASQMLQAGTFSATGDDVIGEEFTINFNRNANHTTALTGTALWNTTTAVPLEDLRTWRALIKQNGNAFADIIVMGSSALNDFFAHADVRNILDNRRMSFGYAEPQFLPGGGVFYGTLEGWKIYGYDEWTANAAGTLTALVPSTGVMIGCSQARMVRHHAAIQDLRSMAAVEYFPKTWQQEDPSQEWLMLQSAPLCCPHQVDSTAFVTVTS